MLKLDVVAMDDVRSAMQGADIIVAATNTNVAVFSRCVCTMAFMSRRSSAATWAWFRQA